MEEEISRVVQGCVNVMGFGIIIVLDRDLYGVASIYWVLICFVSIGLLSF